MPNLGKTHNSIFAGNKCQSHKGQLLNISFLNNNTYLPLQALPNHLNLYYGWRTREDAAAGELDNEHLEEDYSPLCAVPPRTCCQSQSACTKVWVKGQMHVLKLSIAGIYNRENLLLIRKMFEIQTNTNGLDGH